MNVLLVDDQELIRVGLQRILASEDDLDVVGEAGDGADSRAVVLYSGPADRVDTAELAFVHAISTAQRRLWIASPYFVPDEAVMTALQSATVAGSLSN